jgi:RNA polymerase sigma factor (sigma-70 family)
MDLETLLKTKEFLDELSVSVRNIILASFPNMTPEEKEDVDHEVKLKLWRKVARGKKIDNLRSYLWRVVYTTALDLIVGRRNHLPLERILEQAETDGRAPQELLSSDHDSEAREHRLRLEKAVNALPERRKIVARLYFSGQDIAQIADSLRWRQNQVRHLLYRGLADIRRAVSEETDARTPGAKRDESATDHKKGGFS